MPTNPPNPPKPSPPPTDLPIHAFPTASALESFLEREHTTAAGFHLKFAKKASGIQSVSPPDAVATALCFGWIDGRANPLDEHYWLVRYTPRRPKSIWSQKNVATVTRLLAQGRMRPAGLAAVEAAKIDGRWDRAYAGPADMEVPRDFAEVLAGFPEAGRMFESLNKTERYAVLWRVQTAAPAVRAKRIGTLVGMLARGEKPGVGTDGGEKGEGDRKRKRK
ncbi:hypothetical protein N7492_008366 [Penicillium capsulatum]|uniref:Bacteriocin-protection, YdeI or OmpD-Associated n=1 Tax=Penicillium capsulatum TaxID=69766 RepID=A0A9W9LGV4_9EURO|nr:hypothetical protein N7492_008366 [Penicillium capsulatum]